MCEEFSKRSNRLLYEGEIMLRNWVIEYNNWETYNAETEAEAIEMFKRDGHKEESIISIQV
jgi:hypothetical protein